MKKVAIISGVGVALLLGAAYLYFAGKEYVFSFSEAEIQQKLEKNLPLTKAYFLIIQVTLKNPRVQLQNDSDKVNAGLDVVLNMTVNQNALPLGGSLEVSAGIRYVDEEGEFFLTDPAIEKLQVQGISEKYIEKANSALTMALSEYFENYPIYTFSSLDAKQVTARMVLKSVVVENQKLVVTLGI